LLAEIVDPTVLVLEIPRQKCACYQLSCWSGHRERLHDHEQRR
jgi:hypothetical protein